MSSTTLSGPPTSVTPSPAATSSPGGGGGGGGGGPTSSPLLFFVALGFGVVFTNLWIIVGVKYCFRYNQRNRRVQQDENGEPIDMTAMPRQHRRRREKKLMTMDEVNERFPLVKYKAWMTSRAEEGLPTAGGVAIPSASRAASLRNAEGVLAPVRNSHEANRPTTPLPKQSSDEQDDSPEATKTSPEIITSSPRSDAKEKTEGEDKKDEGQEKENTTHVMETPTHTAPSSPITNQITVASSSGQVEDDLDDDDQIQMAVPTEMLANPGDSCAICIDTLEDDDDVRGLTCGHAFHASCLDPWLTSRRACCPLCKADYFVPKPRPEGDAAAADSDRHERGRRPPGARMDMPRPPQYAFQRGGGPRMFFPGRFTPRRNQSRMRYQFPARLPRPQRTNRDARNSQPAPTPNLAPPAPAATTTSPEVQQPSTWRSRMRNFVNTAPTPAVPFRRRSNAEGTSEENASTAQNNTTNPTPGELEAGQR